MLDSAKKEFSKKTRGKYLSEISKWGNSLMIVSEEIKFLGKLLSTGIFEPNIPNLYERLQQYSNKLQDLKNEEILLEKEIEKHKTGFAKELEENEEQKDSVIKRTHIQLRKNINAFLKNNSGLKLEIFNFTGNILKKSR
jgi:hypothetical protein